MRARAIVPQKALSHAKSRLISALAPAARAELTLALLHNVCFALRAVREIEDLAVMTPDPIVAAHAAAWGLRALIDPGPGLNAALERMMQTAGRSHAVLIVAGDLALLRPADVAALLEAGASGRLVLAPSKEGTGTNAVVVPQGMTFHPAYGGASLAAHRAGARSLGYDVIEVRRPGLAFDVDNEADLRALDGLRQRRFHVRVREVPALE